jgi:hypothetical protein
MEQFTRPYVTARSASEMLGVPYLTVVDDIRDGMDGTLPALIGAESGGVWYVAAFELADERLSAHRARLTRSAGDNCVVGLAP